MRRSTRITLIAQLLGFAFYGLIAGEAFAYRIEKEREKTAEIMLSIPAAVLAQIDVGGRS